MKIKVCGMRHPDNIKALLELPIDWMGFIFYRASPRDVSRSSSLARWMDEHQPLFGAVRKVGVFVNAELDFLLNKVHDFQLDDVQLHGNESPEYCRELQSFWSIGSLRRAGLIKAFRVDDSFDFQQTEAYVPFCSHFLFDTKGTGYGGTGTAFNWDLLSGYQGNTPFLLSGGIGPDDAGAIGKLQYPKLAGVDINSCFEVEPGLKDVQKIRMFLNNLKN